MYPVAICERSITRSLLVEKEWRQIGLDVSAWRKYVSSSVKEPPPGPPEVIPKILVLGPEDRSFQEQSSSLNTSSLHVANSSSEECTSGVYGRIATGFRLDENIPHIMARKLVIDYVF